MTFPAGKLSSFEWLATNGTQRDAIGSANTLRVGNFCMLLSNGSRHKCASVDGANSSTWTAVSALGVLNVGDASSSLGDEEFVRVTEPAAGTNTLTLLAAVVGYPYTIEVTAGVGEVDIATTGGDTINGGASPLTAIGPGWHRVIAQTAADWRHAKLA